VRRRLIAAECQSAASCATRGGSATTGFACRSRSATSTDPPSFRNALRGVDTVTIWPPHPRSAAGLDRGALGDRDLRLVDAARRAGAERFVFFSALGAGRRAARACFAAKALAEQAVRESEIESIVFAPSIIYAPDDPT